MTRIEVVHESHVRLSRGRLRSEAWLGDHYHQRWFFAQSISSKRYFVGWILNWRINRAQRRALRRGFWVETPTARVLNPTTTKAA